jgi:glutaminase
MATKKFYLPIAGAIFAATSIISIPLSAQSRSPVAPRDEQVKAIVSQAYEMFKNDGSGKNADYIPYLAHVDSKLFGIAVVTTDNKVFMLGDVDYAFSIQSISKVFTLALAMKELGSEKVFERVGSEPTGRPFNSVSAVVDMPTHTANPLVNAGAIATTSLISGLDANEKWSIAPQIRPHSG